MNRPKKNKTIMLRVSPSMYKLLVKASVEKEKSIPEVIRHCVEKILTQN